MQKKIFTYIGITIVILSIVISVSLTLNDDEEKFNTLSLPELEFTYTESNLELKNNLELHGISMSSPLKLTTRSHLDEFCTFFENIELQNQVEYCTSTELRDPEGKYLGNIHMVGTKQMPKIILALVQSDPFMKNLEHVQTVYTTVVKGLVCDCWKDVQPSGIATVADWVQKQRDFHTSDTKPTSKSSLNLSGIQLQLELTTNIQGYLWKLIISG